MYKIVERNIGRAGRKDQMLRQQEEWNQKYGTNQWLTGYEVNGQFMTREVAIREVYAPAYFYFLDNNPQYVKQLQNSGGVFNPHAYFSNSVDIQSQIVNEYMQYRGLTYNGTNIIAVGTWQPKRDKEPVFQKMQELGYSIQNDKIQYPSISYDLSPYKIMCLHNSELSVEDFWQSEAKCLAVIDSGFTTMVGDIFNLAPENAIICVTTNGIVKHTGEAVIGAGVARLFRDRFKGIDTRLGQFIKKYGNRCFNMGRYSYNNKSFIICTFPTKHDYSDDSDLDLIQKSAEEIVEMANKFNWNEIYLPFPGGGKGNLSWSEVSSRLTCLDSRFIVISNKANDFK